MKLIGALLLLILLISCKNKSTIAVPENHAALSQKENKVFLNETPLTGFVYRLGNIDTVYKAYYKNGKKHGSERYWYSVHQLKRERLFKNNLLHGIQREWYPNGNPKALYTYQENILDGIYMEWNDKGVLIRELYYQDGIMSTTRAWDPANNQWSVITTDN